MSGLTHPRTARELLDIATSNASSEEAVDTLCTRIPASNKGKWKRSDQVGEGSSDPPSKKKNKFRQGGSDPLVAAADRKGRKPLAKVVPNQF